MFLYRQNQKFFTNRNQTNKYIYEPNKLELGLPLAGPKNTNVFLGCFWGVLGCLGLASR